MKTVKKTSVKKYQSGGSARKSTIAGIAIPVVGSAAAAIGTGIKNKKAKKLVKKTQELESEYNTPNKVRNESTFKELENLGKKRGGSVAKMKSGGTAKPKAMYGKTVKPTMMKKGGTTKKSK
jgi:hypothetical protein